MSNSKKTPPSHYTTKHMAAHFGREPKPMRRIMRKHGIACGSGARHTWTKREYDRHVKTLTDNGIKPRDGS